MININYAKLENDKIQYLNLPVVLDEPANIDGVTHPVGAKLYTDREEVLLQLGYKPVLKSSAPGKEGFSYTSSWMETDAEILQIWEAHKLPDDPYVIIDTLTGEVK